MGMMDGKVALVSGGAEGIGGTAGRRFVEEGGSVMLGDIQLEKAQAHAAALGDRAAAIALDVRNLDQWHAAVKATQDKFGKITTLFNIAGISEPGAVDDVDLDSWSRTIDINLNGTFYGCRAALPAIVDSDEDGSIVNVGSMLAMRPGSAMAAYSASKGAVTALSKSLALHCAAQGNKVRVNTVHPGAIDTPMYQRYLAAFPGTHEEAVVAFNSNHPINRVGQAEEVANAMIWLSSAGASFTTANDVTVDGGGSYRE
ncbi:SDR family NAD(P)-dependent oxidoreductase [Parasphingorhabdus cellanae]|uniref:SDR family oxidoreductase n=1 Tax=Parasphingorhabdus cellanae TaxID=2806553 RepID=A0ABX7T122_9SPHN|nr:SDR family oxidoreductase [Parasphingorhabdus cellanae]QTD54663.1 SDR family oxidoreductase [Parasphingorhabdus cellanae]